MDWGLFSIVGRAVIVVLIILWALRIGYYAVLMSIAYGISVDESGCFLLTVYWFCVSVKVWKPLFRLCSSLLVAVFPVSVDCVPVWVIC